MDHHGYHEQEQHIMGQIVDSRVITDMYGVKRIRHVKHHVEII